MTPLQQAEKNLQDYFDSLPLEQREKGLEYQRGLEEEAKKTEGGMRAVLAHRLQHLSMSLVESMAEVQEIAADKIAEQTINKARR